MWVPICSWSLGFSSVRLLLLRGLGDEAEDGLSLLMGVVSEHAPLVAGPAAEGLGDVISGWADSLRAFTADLQGYADALVAVDRDVAQVDGEQREGFVASSYRIAGRMGG